MNFRLYKIKKKLSNFIKPVYNNFLIIIKLIKKGFFILKRDGLIIFTKKIITYLLNIKKEVNHFSSIKYTEFDYENWIQNIEKIEKININLNYKENISQLKYKPKISIVLPIYNSDEIFLRKAIFSVINQYYSNWELLIIDDCSTKKIIPHILNEFEKRDERVKVYYSKKNEGISITTNKAVELSTGEFIGFLDHDDELEPEALLEVLKSLNINSDLDFIYSDDDKIDEDNFRYDSQFKPSWSPELLLSYCYIGHFKVVRKTLFIKLNGFKKEFDGAQDYEFLLRLAEKTNKVAHIQKILYHWRSLPGSIAFSTNQKPLSIERGCLAVQETIKRRKIKGKIIQSKFANFLHLGIYKIIYKPIDYQEKVTIIIPTKDNVSLLKKCISSIKEKTNYLNYDILVINNNSKEEETYKYLENEKIKFINIKNEKFNFSEINNIAVGKIDSEFILFMNNDVEVVSPDWLIQMVGTLNLDNKIGAVGARLIYSNRLIQHAGVILGLNNFSAGHANKLIYYNDLGYLNYNMVMRNYSAVTAACMLTRKSVFEKVDGFDEKNLPVSYNDVDYCLKLIELNYRIVYNPDALLYHHEGSTRGFCEDEKELIYFKNKWSNYIINDFYYNKNLSLEDEQFKIRQK